MLKTAAETREIIAKQVRAIHHLRRRMTLMKGSKLGCSRRDCDADVGRLVATWTNCLCFDTVIGALVSQPLSIRTKQSETGNFPTMPEFAKSGRSDQPGLLHRQGAANTGDLLAFAPYAGSVPSS